MKQIVNIKSLILVIAVTVLGTLHSQAQNQASAKKGNLTEVMVINTSAQCDMCRMKIEGKLNESKGVRMATLDIKTKKLTVKYNPEKTSPEEIKKTVSALGYDADEVKANTEAHKNLPECCQKH